MTVVASLEGVIRIVGLPEAVRGLKQVGDAVDRTQAQLDAAAKSFDSAGQRMHNVGSKLTRSVSVPLALVGAAAVKTGMDFGQQMSKVEAKAGATGAEIDQLRQQAIQLGSDTAFSAKEAAQGMENLAAAGLKPKQILAAMPGLLDAAAASGEGLAEVSSIVVTALSGFNLEASESTRVADVLAKASNESQASIGSLGEGLKYLAPIASTTGFEIEQVAGMMTILSKAGLDGSMAGTSLRMGLTRLAAPTKKARTALDELGVSLTDAKGKAKPTEAILRELSTRFQTLSGEQKIQAAQAIFGTEAMTGMLNLLAGGPGTLDKFTNSMRNSSGEAKRMGDIMRDNLAGDLEALKGSIESAFITGTGPSAGAMRDLAQGAMGVVNAFTALDPATQQVAVKLAGLAVVTGPALMAFGSIATGSVAAVAGVTALGTGLGAVAFRAASVVPALSGVALAMVANPLLTGVAFAGIAATAGAMALFGGNSRQAGIDAAYVAREVQGVRTVLDGLTNSLLGQRQAEVQVAMAQHTRKAARQALTAANKSGNEAAIAAATRGLAQAEVGLDQALVNRTNSTRTARQETRNALKAGQDARNEYEMSTAKLRELRAENDRMAKAQRDGTVHGREAARVIGANNKAIDEAREKQAAAARKLLEIGRSYETLATAAGKPTKNLQKLKDLIGGLKSKQLKIDAQVTGYDRVLALAEAWERVGRAQNAAADGNGGGGGPAAGHGTIGRISALGQIMGFPTGKKGVAQVIEHAQLESGQAWTTPAGGGAPVANAAVQKHLRAKIRANRVKLKNALRRYNALHAQLITAPKKKKGAIAAKMQQLQSVILGYGMAIAIDNQALDKPESTDIDLGSDTPAESGTSTPDVAGSSAPDPNLSAQLAQQQARADGLAANYALSQRELAAVTSAGDLGAGGANAWQAARGNVQIVVNSLTGYDPAIQQAVSAAVSGGYTQGANADVLYSGRM